LVYDELRKLAAARLAKESPGQALQPTALVHEAYLRLVGGDAEAHRNGRGHFFAAAAEAMRHILVDAAASEPRSAAGGTVAFPSMPPTSASPRPLMNCSTSIKR
jgi:hypothetical protein